MRPLLQANAWELFTESCIPELLRNQPPPTDLSQLHLQQKLEHNQEEFQYFLSYTHIVKLKQTISLYQKKKHQAL